MCAAFRRFRRSRAVGRFAEDLERVVAQVMEGERPLPS